METLGHGRQHKNDHRHFLHSLCSITYTLTLIHIFQTRADMILYFHWRVIVAKIIRANNIFAIYLQIFFEKMLLVKFNLYSEKN